ncbi:MAG: hypothetical protein PHO37_04240 [Kiritimatiellae bacterium]|nr:hypothetical protein [Kiritimatiellia bacterium]
MLLKVYHQLVSLFLLLCLCNLQTMAAISAAEEWSTYVGGNSGSHSVTASTIDESGRVYIGGYSFNGVIDNDDGLSAIVYPPEGGANDAFVALISPAGQLLWYSVVGAGKDDEVHGVAQYGQAVFAAARLSHPETYDRGSDAALYSFSKADGTFNWSNPVVIGAPHTTNAFNAATVDTNGNVYAIGYTSMTGLTPTAAGYTAGGTLYGKELKGNLDACVVKVSPLGTVLWVHYLGGFNEDRALTCTMGTNGFLYVGGETRSPDWVSHPNNVTPTPLKKAGFIVKLSTDGAHQWSTYLGGSQDDSVVGLAVEKSSGQLFAAGTTSSSGFMSSKLRQNLYGGGGSDGFVTSITDNESTPIVNWSRFYGSNQVDAVTSIQPLGDSQLVLGGYTSAGGWLPNSDNAFHGVADGFIMMIGATNGESLWSQYIGGSERDQTMTVAATSGALYAGGLTLSDDDWVSGGFRSVWHDPWDSPEALGFLVKYERLGYIPDPPTIVTHPKSISVEEEQNAIFTVEAQSVEAFTYQWHVNAEPVATATNTAFTLNSVTLAQSGDQITCVVSNIAGAVVSEIAILSVTAIPKGWITMNLAPAAAVSNGVAWSIDAGSTWHTSGDVVNLRTGVYAIIYQTVFGWAAPAAPSSTIVLNLQTNSLTATFTEIYYSNARIITGTNVVITVKPPGGTEDWTLRETIPAGLTPYNFPASATWLAGSRTLRFIGEGSSPAQFSYSVTGAEGSYQLSGTVNFYPSGTVTTVGDSQVTIAVQPPVIPDPDIIGFTPASGLPGNFLLRFISVLNQSYLIETNAVPGAFGWALQGQVNGSADETSISVPSSAPALFYRVRVP